MSEYAYGLHAVEELLRANAAALARLWLLKGRDDHRLQRIVKLAASNGVEVRRASRARLDEMTSGRHQGVVAEFATAGEAPVDLRWSEAQLRDNVKRAVAEQAVPLLLVLDGVTDPHNLGACLRSADAAGVLAVVTPKDNAADVTAVVRKVACGATESIPLVRVTNLVRTLQMLQEAGVWIYGAAGEASQSLYDSDLTGPLALVMGAEGDGMRRLTREHCDFLVKLPMAGRVSSLNVSVATGVCLFEICRQRAVAAP